MLARSWSNDSMKGNHFNKWLPVTSREGHWGGGGEVGWGGVDREEDHYSCCSLLEGLNF